MHIQQSRNEVFTHNTREVNTRAHESPGNPHGASWIGRFAHAVAGALGGESEGSALQSLASFVEALSDTLSDALYRLIADKKAQPDWTNNNPHGPFSDGAPAMNLPSPYGGAESIYSSAEQLRKIDEAPLKTPDMPETSGLKDDEKFDVYQSLFNLKASPGAKQAVAEGEVVILALRVPTATTENHGKGSYDDRLVVFSRNKDGDVQVEEFNNANTEPSAQYDAARADDKDIKFRRAVGRDVNGDGIKDPGRVREGSYEMKATTHYFHRGQPQTFALRPTADSVAANPGGVERDTNHDGFFDAKDEDRIDALNNTFKIHIGSRGSTDSAGCTTITSNDYARFEDAVRAEPQQKNWHYVVVETK